MTETANSQSVRNEEKTVFIVDDHPLLRQGLALLVNREEILPFAARLKRRRPP